MFISLYLVPVAACEVRHGDRHSSVGDAGCSQFAEARPFGGIVHVFVEGQTVLQAVDEAVVHDEVHAAVAAHFLGFGLDFLCNRMEVFSRNLVAHFCGHEGMRIEVLAFGEETLGKFFFKDGVAFNRVFVGKTLSTCQLIKAVVRAIGVYIMLDEQGFTQFGLNHCGRHVAIGKVVGAHHLLGDFLAIVGGRTHGYEGLHAVATVDVESLAERSEAVGGVDVTGMALVELQTPVLVVFVPERFQIVDIGTFAVDEFAKEALLGHVEGGQLEEVVTAVFEHHAVALGLFGHVDKLPALRNGGGGRHFHGNMFALLHGVDGHRDVHLPVGADVDEVDVVALAEFHPSFTSGIGNGAGQAFLFKDVGLDFLDTVGLNVAQGDNSHAIDVGHTVDGIGTAHTEADEADADVLDGIDGELEEAFLSFGTLWFVKYNGVVDDAVVALADFGFSRLLFAAGGGHSQ